MRGDFTKKKLIKQKKETFLCNVLCNDILIFGMFHSVELLKSIKKNIKFHGGKMQILYLKIHTRRIQK